jgi:hypothetical protein
MTERMLTTSMRVVAGLFGTAVLCLGLFIMATELQAANNGSPPVPAILAAVVCAFVALGGASLLRSAIRGRITVRPTRRRPGR